MPLPSLDSNVFTYFIAIPVYITWCDLCIYSAKYQWWLLLYNGEIRFWVLGSIALTSAPGVAQPGRWHSDGSTCKFVKSHGDSWLAEGTGSLSDREARSGELIKSNKTNSTHWRWSLSIKKKSLHDIITFYFLLSKHRPPLSFNTLRTQFPEEQFGRQTTPIL